MEPPQPPPAALYLVILFALLLLSMFFSASETAFLSASKLRIRYLTEKKNRAAGRVSRLIARRDLFLNTILIGNNVVNIASSALLTALAIRLFGDAGVGMATALATILILVFGEIFPKSVALLRPEKTALAFSLPLSIISLILTPVVFIFSACTRIISRIFGARTEAGGEKVTEEDIRALIETGEEQGLLESRERAMMSRILKYTDLTARDIMVPRTDIVAVGLDMPRADILALSRATRFSRFPVYGENIDDIRGILYIKDFLFDESDDEFPVRRLLRPALFVFETQKMPALQNQFRAGNRNFAVVIDEYGGTAGIVTNENLVKEIFGGIRGEFGVPGAPDATAAPAGTPSPFTVPGAERLDLLSERLGVTLASSFYETIGGLIMERYGDIPARGTVIAEQGWTFTVAAMTGNRIDEVRVARPGGER